MTWFLHNMSLRLFNHTPNHWRNGTSVFGRSVCWAVGEARYDNIRVYKRTLYAEWWYLKQTYLHWLYVNKNDWANFFAILPKPDSSHGFPWKETQSRYGQFADDSINSDGYVGWYTYFWVGAAALWSLLYYFWPRRWFDSYDMMDEDNKERVFFVDGTMSSGYDQTLTYWWGYWKLLLAPHLYERYRDNRFINFAPISAIQPAIITLNRQNTYYDHKWRGVGYDDCMG